MDSKRFHEARERLKTLDEMCTYKVRPRSGALRRLNIDQIAEQQRDLADYTIALREIVHELFEAIAAPSNPAGS